MGIKSVYMNYLTLENVTKSYGPKILFKNVNLIINKGERIALVAKNGTGKTTLLRVLNGTEGSEGENAKIIFAKDIRIGTLEQDPLLPEGATAIEAIFHSDNPQTQAIKNYEKALLDDNLDDIQKYLEEIDHLQAWDFEAKIKEVLSKLKIDLFLNQKVSTLSGGQKKRVSLATLLIDEPDFMILDEPTNHLDLLMIEWLEAYFAARPSLTIFMVTHDRYFLDAVCNKVIELDGGNFYPYKGNYAYYLEQKALRQEVEAATMAKDKKLYLRELDWMRRQPQARSTKAQSRIDVFYDLEDKVSQKVEKDAMKIDIKTTWLGSKIVELHNVSKGYQDRKLIENFSYKFRRGERVGIVGENGAGKSTLLKLLTNEIQPDGGKVVIGDTIQFGYYSQDGMTLREDKRVIEVIQDIAEFIPLAKGLKITASNLLERFLFTKEQQQVYASQLSGGEKRRLYLLTVIMKNPNFLILDEPTNDLDILTLNVLEDFLLEQYNGCLLIVTHDRYFMDRLVEHLFIFEGEGEIRDYNGNYTDYREAKKIEDRQAKSGSKPTTSSTPMNAGSVSQAQKANDAERKEYNRLGKEIEKLETRKVEIENKFNDVANLKGDDITKLSKELADIHNQLEIKELRWLELSEMV
jgi:ABC transport system ATP-binding/permease protein